MRLAGTASKRSGHGRSAPADAHAASLCRVEAAARVTMQMAGSNRIAQEHADGHVVKEEATIVPTIVPSTPTMDRSDLPHRDCQVPSFDPALTSALPCKKLMELLMSSFDA